MNKQVVADLHIHTVACRHAQSTILEIMSYAAKKGLKAVAITDHGPALSDGAHRWHFGQTTLFPRVIDGVYMLRGIEANIQNPDGVLDLDERRLQRLDMAIASLHSDVFTFSTKDDLTKVMEKVAKNPLVTVLGHMGCPSYPFDYERIVSICQGTGVVFEINQNSFFARPGSEENCKKIAKLCKKYAVPVVADSDAHNAFLVGKVGKCLNLLEEIDFPEELIINTSLKRLDQFFREKKGLDIMGELKNYEQNPEEYM